MMKLKDDFYQQIRSSQVNVLPSTKPSLQMLTKEELELIEQLWVELVLWKKTHSH